MIKFDKIDGEKVIKFNRSLHMCSFLGITNADEFALFIDEEKEFEEEKKIEDADKQKTNTIRRVVRKSYFLKSEPFVPIFMSFE